MKYLILALLIALVPVAATAQLSPEQRSSEIEKLKWERGGTHKLGSSQSILSIPSDHVVVIGSDAVRLEQLLGNGDLPGTEAVAINHSDEQVIFQNIQEGYVSIDDWSDVNPDDLIKAISDNTEKANVDRARDGFDPIHTIGWIQQPALDRTTNTVYWSVGVREGKNNTANSVALRLSRRGFERITWVGDGNAYQAVGGELDLMLRSFNFEAGSRYTDFTSGDHVAAYTIAGLVATLAGAKLVKVAAAAGFLILLKKFGIFALVAIGAVTAKFRNFFRRQKPPPSMPPLSDN